MDLNQVAVQKAIALEAFESGEYVEAERVWAALDTLYHRYELYDGRVSITFNRLLVAIEGGHRHRATRLMGLLAELLESGRDSSAAFEVAERVCTLFAEPISGLDHEATAALVALAGDLVGQIYIEPDRTITPEQIPIPAALVGGSAVDTAVRVLRLADELRSHPACPDWVRSVQRLFTWSLGPGEEFGAAMDEYRQAQSNTDSLRAYRSILKAQECASEGYFPAACELLVGLELLEEGGLPKKLAFAPNSPEEKRCLLAAELFRRLSLTLCDDHGVSEMLTLFNREVVRYADRVLRLVSERGERGSRRAIDVERVGRTQTLRAGALHDLGASAEAIAALESSYSPAERGAFGNPLVAVDLFEQSARIREYLVEGPAAAQAYLAMVRAAAPGLLAASSELGQANVIQSVAVHLDRVVAAVTGLAGIARTDLNSKAERYTQLARRVLALVGPGLRGDLLASCQLKLELTAARNGESGASLKALEAARVLGDAGASALAFVYWAIERLQGEPGEDAIDEAFGLLDQAISAAINLEPGEYRHRLELLVVSLFERWASERDRARYEVHLRRTLEMMGTAWRPARQEAWIGYLPSYSSQVFEELVERFVELERAGLALRMCRAKRLRTQRASTDPVERGLKPVSPELRADYRFRWLGEGIEDSSAFSWRENWAETHQGVEPELRQRGWSDASLEYCFFNDWGVLFVDRAGEQFCHRIGLGSEEVRALLLSREPSANLAIADRLVQPAITPLRNARHVLVSVASELIELYPHLIQNGKLAGNGLWHPVDGLPEYRPAARHDSRIAVIGDAATSCDLRLSTLAGPNGYDVVTTEHGASIRRAALSQTLVGNEVIQLVGDIVADGQLDLSDDEAPFQFTELSAHLAEAKPNLVVVTGPVPRTLGGALARTVLSGGANGVILRHTEGDLDRTFLLSFLKHARACPTSDALARAFGMAHRDAVAEGQTDEVRTAYTLYLRTTP